MKGCNPPEYVYTGEMACKTRFWNPVNKENYQYTPMLEGEGDTPLRMMEVLMVDTKLEEISKNNKLSKGFNKNKVKKLGALRAREEDKDELIKETKRKDQFDEEFDIDSNKTITYTNNVEETD